MKRTHCAYCSRPMPELKGWNSCYCPTCKPIARMLGQSAHMKVYRAVATQQLPPARSLTCTDCCGKPAHYYEHRDYDKPLDVVPICQRCNMKRGPAKYNV